MENTISPISTHLSVKGVNNAKKSDMVERLAGVDEKRQAYNALRTKVKAPRQQVQCSFRVMNILFSDRFAGDFANLGDVASKSLLDTGKATALCGS